jgi:transposase
MLLPAYLMPNMTFSPRGTPLKKRAATSGNGARILRVRQVVERSFAWAGRLRRLARDYERLPDTLAGLHFIAFAILMAARFVQLACLLAQSS